VDVDTVLGRLYALVVPHLTEKQRRLLAGAAAGALGRGGGVRMARLTGLSRPTVYAGVRQLDDPPDPRGRVRRPGGGPKRLVKRQPGLLQALDELIDPDTRGDPSSPLRWTCKSTRQLADALGAQGFQVSDDTVGRLLRQQGYAAAHPKDPGGRPASRPGRAVSVRQPAGQAALGRRPAGRQCGHQEEGTGRPLRQRQPGVAAGGRARAGAGTRLPRQTTGQKNDAEPLCVTCAAIAATGQSVWLQRRGGRC
jgi:hypothetical protein